MVVIKYYKTKVYIVNGKWWRRTTEHRRLDNGCEETTTFESEGPYTSICAMQYCHQAMQSQNRSWKNAAQKFIENKKEHAILPWYKRIFS